MSNTFNQNKNTSIIFKSNLDSNKSHKIGNSSRLDTSISNYKGHTNNESIKDYVKSQMEKFDKLKESCLNSKILPKVDLTKNKIQPTQIKENIQYSIESTGSVKENNSNNNILKCENSCLDDSNLLSRDNNFIFLKGNANKSVECLDQSQTAVNNLSKEYKLSTLSNALTISNFNLYNFKELIDNEETKNAVMNYKNNSKKDFKMDKLNNFTLKIESVSFSLDKNFDNKVKLINSDGKVENIFQWKKINILDSNRHNEEEIVNWFLNSYT